VSDCLFLIPDHYHFSEISTYFHTYYSTFSHLYMYSHIYITINFISSYCTFKIHVTRYPYLHLLGPLFFSFF